MYCMDENQSKYYRFVGTNINIRPVDFDETLVK